METWKPFGQFPVGIVDVEWLGGDEVSPSHVDPAAHLHGRLYYPCAPPRRRWWVPRLPGIDPSAGVSWLPGLPYAYGLASFIFFRRPKGWLYWLAKQAIFLITLIFGRLQRLALIPGAPLARLPTRLPVVVFSHGLGGNRAVYAIICSELASHGYVVLAVEHADGSASAARLAAGRGWRFYKGLGGEEGQVEKTRHRVQEMKTAAALLTALDRGEAVPGLALTPDAGVDPGAFMAGALDLRCLAAVGHSYGGATAAALVSEDAQFAAGVCLDPWWAAVPEEAACLSKWRTQAPLLVMGSHDWNVPNPAGETLCGPVRQGQIFDAARVRGNAGAGAMLLVISGSSHNTFADPLALFSEHVGWALRALGLTARLDPVAGIHLVNAAVLNFLSLHLPLTGDQRQLQTWAPSSGHTALDRVTELTTADARAATGRGPLAWLFPGRGLLNAVSDALLNNVLASHVVKKISTPRDVVTGDEVLEAVLPSAVPAAGDPGHPHAPSAVNGGSGEEDHPEYPPMDARRRQALRSAVGCGYAAQVQEGHAAQVRALLGDEHVWKCEVHE